LSPDSENRRADSDFIGRRHAITALVTILALGSTLLGCGGGEPRSAATASDYKVALRGAPSALRKLYRRQNEIVGGGVSAYRLQIKALAGYPIVVNKWASWCGPCRFEFPFFQSLARKHGRRIAFLAVDSRDARSDARDFLRQFPVPYPSYFDSDGAIARSFRGDRASPSTAFYDEDGKLVLTKQGGYASRAALAKDIAQYAR
jgi:thiol-disulfide isomerase/thioredoxin